MEIFSLILHESLRVTAAISLPVLLVGTLVGTGIALLQAVTQVQEQTLSVLPKFFCVGCCIIVGSQNAFDQLAQLLRHGVAVMPLIVRSL